MAQGQVLESELTMAADEEREQPEQVENDRDHEPDFGRPRPTDQSLAGRTGFRRRTPLRNSSGELSLEYFSPS
jgi:hypothetical protein